MLTTQRRFWQSGSLIVSLFLVAGCGSAPTGPKMYSVSGTVTFDGKPLPKGDIILFPATPGLAPDAGSIKDGKYSLNAKIGERRVDIRASREVPGKTKPRVPPLTGDEPVIESYIPAVYNSETTLKATVTDSAAKNKFDFALTSEGK
jgi:hypothetical protein